MNCFIEKVSNKVFLSVFFLILGFLLGYSSTQPGINKIENGLLTILDAESIRLSQNAVKNRTKIPILLDAMKDKPELLTVMQEFVNQENNPEFIAKMGAGSFEIMRGISCSRVLVFCLDY